MFLAAKPKGTSFTLIMREAEDEEEVEEEESANEEELKEQTNSMGNSEGRGRTEVRKDGCEEQNKENHFN